MRLCVVQPYVPRYRQPLFDAVERLIRQEQDISGSLEVLAGTPKGSQSKRLDNVNSAGWLTELPDACLRTPLGSIKWKRGVLGRTKSADVVICELEPGNLTTWLLLMRRRLVGGPRVILWGHGKAYTHVEKRLAPTLRALQVRIADLSMTYAHGGRAALLKLGLPATKVRVIGNSTDSAALRRKVRERRNQSSLTCIPSLEHVQVASRNIAIYIGGLDADKRIDFLLAAAEHAYGQDPTFLLVVAGSGDAETSLAAAQNQPWLRRLPYADQEAWADLAAVANAVWVPGRVGLIAVDALASELPLLTTDFPFHAPELEFLTEGQDYFVLSQDPKIFAAQALDIMRSPRRERHETEDMPTISSVANNIVAAALNVCQEGPPWA